jgi:uncharacterized protein YqeY
VNYEFTRFARVLISRIISKGEIMTLKETLTQHMKDAMRAKDAPRLNTIRMALAEIKKREIDHRQEGAAAESTDDDVIATLQKMIKQRKDSVAQYEKAGRQDLADIETAEINVLTAYLPQPMSDAEIDALIQAAMNDTGAKEAKDMGKLMAALKPKIAGKADMGVVSAKVKKALNPS